MELFNKNLLQSAEIMDTLYNALGDYKPKKRILKVDYKEKGIDKNIDLIIYQHPLWDDKALIEELLKVYAEQRKEIGFIMEMDKNGNPIIALYSTRWYLEESMNDFIKEWRGDRK